MDLDEVTGTQSEHNGVMTFAIVGLVLHGLLFAALTAICAFDDRKLAPDWADCLVPLGVLLAPFALAATGVARRSRGLLVAAAVVGGLLGLLSLTGPGLFVLVPAILYALSAPARSQAEGTDHNGQGG